MPCTMIDTGQALNHVRFRACGRPVICEGKISGGIQILRGFNTSNLMLIRDGI